MSMFYYNLWRYYIIFRLFSILNLLYCR